MATIIIILIGVPLIYFQIREGQNNKILKYTDLTFDECYVISCLMQVSTATIYGQAIRHNLQNVHDSGRLRQLIREVSQSLQEQPDVMYNILGAEAFEAVREYHQVLISNDPVVPGEGSS